MVKDKLEEILIYFDPVQLDSFNDRSYKGDPSSIGRSILINCDDKPITPSDKIEIALIIVDQINGNEEGCTVAFYQAIREEIYKLKKVSSALKIADFGNLKTGKNRSETLFILQEVCSLLFQMKINVLIIGASQPLTIAPFRSIKEFENDINLVHIDSKIDLTTPDEPRSEEAYLNEIIENDASHLYNISCIGHQSYFVDQKQLNRLSELYFEHFRLGTVRNNLEEIEPVIRDADLVSFDMGAIKAADAPAVKNNSPNGFFSDEACRLARYAGISDRVRSFGIFELDTTLDISGRTSKLAAQMVWYYMEGFINRKHEYPQTSLDDCIKYIVEIDEIEIPIVFYKSNKTKRWWIEINSLPESADNKVSVVSSCSETDYFKACNNEIPDKWWINFKKLR
jgi:arginase family enzyme